MEEREKYKLLEGVVVMRRRGVACSNWTASLLLREREREREDCINVLCVETRKAIMNG